MPQEGQMSQYAAGDIAASNKIVHR